MTCRVIIAFLLAFQAVATSLAYADEEDNRIADLQIAIAPGSPEKIYATATAYEARSVRYAYVNAKIIEAFIGANSVNGIPAAKMTAILDRARKEATDYVNGVNYRGGWMESVAKDTVSTLTGLAKKGVPIDISNTSGQAVEAFLDYVAKPGQSPEMPLNAQIVTNSFSLRHMRNQGPLPQALVQSATDFFPEINPNRDLSLNGAVVDARLKAGLKSLLEKNGLKLEDLLRGQGDLSARVAELKEAADKLLAEKVAKAEELARRSISPEETAAAEREQTRRELEMLTSEVSSGFGAFSAAASLLGDQKAAAFFARGGQFFASGMQSFLLAATFSANPFAAVNSILQTAVLGRGLFGGGEVDATRRILDELQKVKGMIAELGAHIDARFNALDSRLQIYMRESLQRMDQQTYLLEKNDADIRYLKNAIAQVRQETYGSYLLSAGLTSSRLQHDCFTPSAQKNMNEDLFRLCRNELALLALVGPAAGGENASIAAGPAILDPIADTLNASYPLPRLAGEVKANPVAWLSATKRLVALARLYPKFAHLILEEEYEPASFVNYAKLRDAGEYYQALLQNMAIESPGGARPKLRRAYLDKFLDRYAVAATAGVRLGAGLVNRFSLGALNPKLDLDKQGGDDPAAYSFMNEGIDFCDDSSTFEWHYNNDFGSPLFHFPWTDRDLRAGHRKHTDQLKWPREFLSIVPGAVKFATRGKGAMQAQARTCIRRVHWLSQAKRGQISNYISTLNLDIDLIVSYVKDGQVKNLIVGSYQTVYKMNVYSYSGPNVSPLKVFWSGHEPKGNEMAMPHTIDQSILKNFKGAFTFKESNLKEFTADLAPHLRMAQVEVEQALANDTASLDQSANLAREQLAFVLTGGLANTNPQTSQLLSAVSNSLNLPSAKAWAMAVVEQGAGEAQLEQALKERLDAIRSLLDSVERAGDFRPKADLFGPRLEELEAVGAR